MRNALIGYTGFVGNNINKQNRFDFQFNSSNINDIKNKDFDLVVCAGITANKWWSNRNPQEDLFNIKKLLDILKTVKAKQFVLISTIDVFSQPVNADELSDIDQDKILPYGKNRFFVEEFVRKNFSKNLIVRLPGLFGDGLRKNFIFDLINNAPKTVESQKFSDVMKELSLKDKNEVVNSYDFKDGYWFLKNNLDIFALSKINNLFRDLDFNSLSFTHSDSVFQFYNLENIWNNISSVLNNNVDLLHLSTEPISCKELAKEVFDIDFSNKTTQDPLFYNMKTVHGKFFADSRNGYICDKNKVLSDIRDFKKQILK